MNRRKLSLSLGLLALSPWAARAQPSAYPSRPVSLVVPFAAGSSSDTLARLISSRAATPFGGTFVIDNRPGANGVIAAMAVVRAKPDGQTLFFSSNSALATNVSLVKALPYDPLKDFTPIAGGSITATAVIVKASSSFKTFAELIAAARQAPGKITFGHGSSFVQVQVASMNTKGGVQLMGVPYKTTGDAVTGVLSGVVDVTITDPGNAMALAKGGQVRILAVTSLKRTTALPDVPAIAETIPGHDFVAWAALVGPAGMQRDIVERLGKAMRDAQADPEIIERLRNGGRAPLVLGPEELKAFMAAEVQKWEVLVRDAKIEPI